MTGAPRPSGKPSQKPPRSDWREGLREASPYLGLGMQLAMAMVFFTGVGYALDVWLETTPWLTVAGAVVGMVAVFVQIVRVSNELARASKRASKRKKSSDAAKSGDPE